MVKFVYHNWKTSRNDIVLGFCKINRCEKEVQIVAIWLIGMVRNGNVEAKLEEEFTPNCNCDDIIGVL